MRLPALTVVCSLNFAMMLTGCGGGTAKTTPPPSTPPPAAPPPSVTAPTITTQPASRAIQIRADRYIFGYRNWDQSAELPVGKELCDDLGSSWSELHDTAGD